MSEKAVGIHFGPKKNIERHDIVVDRSYGSIIRHIHEAGVPALITRGTALLNPEDGGVGEVWEPHFQVDGTLRTVCRIGDGGLKAFGVIRDLTRSLPSETRSGVPLINGPEITAYGTSKYKVYDELARAFQVPTVNLDAGPSSFDGLKGDRIVLKPDKGAGGIGVRIVSKHQAAGVFDEVGDTRYIAQEFIDATAPLPTSIKGLDEEESARLDALADRPKELRLFCCYDETGLTTIPIARMMKAGDEINDTWVYVDPDTVPDEPAVQLESIIAEMCRRTGITSVYGAGDLSWGSTASEPDRRWIFGELNLWMPVMSKRKPTIPAMRDKALSSQLIRLARKKEEASR